MTRLDLATEQKREISGSVYEEDARRRFILALRAMTVRREKDEKNQRMIAEWSREIELYVKRIRKKSRNARISRYVKIGIALFLVFYLHIHWQWWWLLFLGGGAVEMLSGKQKDATTALARTRDPRALSALALACRDGDQDTRAIAEEGLIRILPTVHASDRELISYQGMEALLDILRDTNVTNAKLITAILKGLPQIGDAKAIPAVTRRLNMPMQMRFVNRFFSRFAPIRELRTVLDGIKTEAEECLRVLEIRAEHDKMKSLLLRPAENPVDGSALLLRPAGNAPLTPPEQLLRPASGTD